MKATKSETRPVARDFQRIRDPDALIGIRSSDELDAGSIAQIDRGNHLHVIRSSITALTKSRPPKELFSGWNWTPTVFALRTTEANFAS
jgi:hypothetical protein